MFHNEMLAVTMQIVVTQKQSGFGVASALFLGLLIMSAIYSVSVLYTPMMWFGFAACVISIFGIAHSIWNHDLLLLQIDDSGIFDRRLGVGKISWEDVEDVQLQVTEEQRYLCFKMANAKPYINRLSGADRERVLFHRSLGFHGFNVEVSPVDVNLLELKKQIDKRIRRI